MNLGQVQDPEAYTISQRESEEYDKWEFLLEAKSNRQAEIKMQAGMSSMLIIAWRMSCSQILRELHFVICVRDLMIALLQHFFLQGLRCIQSACKDATWLFVGAREELYSGTFCL